MDANVRSGSPNPEPSTRTSSFPAKRKRYTPVACEECKRRKVKCDGKVPCGRCARSPNECTYNTQKLNSAETRQRSEWKLMNDKIEKLQEQISMLVSNTSSTMPPSQLIIPTTPLSLSVSEPASVPIQSPRADTTRSWYPSSDKRDNRRLQYMGPTSSAFTLGVANKSLRRMGIQSTVDLTHEADDIDSMSENRNSALDTFDRHEKDALCSISQSEAVRLITVYEREVGSMYPFLNQGLLLNSVRRFYSNIDAGTNQNSLPRHSSTAENMLSGGILDILKLVIAVAMVVENRGPSPLAKKLLDNVESGFGGRMCGSPVHILELQAWTLMSILQFYCDEEVIAWRIIGFAARAAVEIGLHRRDVCFAQFRDQQQRFWTNRLFWCIYVLDRRWSFVTGLPFAINDSDMDPDLSEPSGTDSNLLTVMIACGRIGSKVWKAAGKPTTKDTAEKASFLEFQISQWQNSIPSELRLQSQDENMLQGSSRTQNKLRVLLYLHANQMRLLIFRRALLTPKTATDDLVAARKAMAVAKDTVQVIVKLNRLSDIYDSQQTQFNYFLASALAVLFLAACHATAHFNDTCREEFFMALELIRGFSGKSYVGRKFWKSIQHLKGAGNSLGIVPDKPDLDQRQANNLQGKAFSSQLPFSRPNAFQEESMSFSDDLATFPALSFPYDDHLDGTQLSNELTILLNNIEPNPEDLQIEGVDGQWGINPFEEETAEDVSRSLLSMF